MVSLRFGVRGWMPLVWAPAEQVRSSCRRCQLCPSPGCTHVVLPAPAPGPACAASAGYTALSAWTTTHFVHVHPVTGVHPPRRILVRLRQIQHPSRSSADPRLLPEGTAAAWEKQLQEINSEKDKNHQQSWRPHTEIHWVYPCLLSRLREFQHLQVITHITSQKLQLPSKEMPPVKPSLHSVLVLFRAKPSKLNTSSSNAGQNSYKFNFIFNIFCWETTAGN